MTVPFEFEEPEPIDLSYLVYARCVQCDAPRIPCAPDQARVALCGPCRAQNAASATCISRLPAVTPPPIVWAGSEKILAENGAERAAVVPPEFVCGDRCGHQKPAPVVELYAEALSAGWESAVRHSRGGMMGRDGKQLAVADIWSVRFQREAWRGYAIRRGEGWDSVCVLGEALPMFLAMGVTDLRPWLAEPERPAEWYAAIRERVAAGELAKKEIKCPGPGECEWVDAGRGTHTHRANGDIKVKKSRKEQVSAN